MMTVMVSSMSRVVYCFGDYFSSFFLLWTGKPWSCSREDSIEGARR